ncbi:MAG: hypothetical protein V7785_23195 [Bermanella sp.]
MKTYNTDSQDHEKLTPHGQVTFTIQDKNIIIYHARGPFNVELFKTFEVLQSNILKEIDKETKSWVDLIIFEESCMATKELFLEFTSYLKSMKSNNLIPLISAYVFKDGVEGSHIIPGEIQKCYQDANMNYGAFNNEEEAMAHIKTYLPKK